MRTSQTFFTRRMGWEWIGGMGSFWWVFMFLAAWGVLWFTTDTERFKAFWTGGLWSVGLAMVCEMLIRWGTGYFEPDSLIFPFLGTDLLNFLGPRFVEGVLFMQTLPPRHQLLRVALAVVAVSGAESLSPLTESYAFTLNGIGVSLGVNGLRFLSLLGVYRSLHFGPARERLLKQQKRRQRKKALLKASRLLWPVSWPFFSISALLIVKGMEAFTKRPSSD